MTDIIDMVIDAYEAQEEDSKDIFEAAEDQVKKAIDDEIDEPEN